MEQLPLTDREREVVRESLERAYDRAEFLQTPKVMEWLLECSPTLNAGQSSAMGYQQEIALSPLRLSVPSTRASPLQSTPCVQYIQHAKSNLMWEAISCTAHRVNR